jgi:hypothetical protein
MSTQTDYTPEAWKAITGAPAGITQLVVTASFGVGDLIKEAKALGQRIEALAQQPGDLPLMAALAADLKQQQEDEKKVRVTSSSSSSSSSQKEDPAVQKARLLAELGTAVAAVDATATPEEAAQLKQWLYGVGDAVAKAAKEGDFLGFGGKQVSDAEAAVLVEIKGVLGL